MAVMVLEASEMLYWRMSDVDLQHKCAHHVYVLLQKSRSLLNLPKGDIFPRSSSYFDRRVEAARRCIIERESEGFYNVRSRSGYYGAYQMSPQLADGATWMMLPEARARMGAERAKSLMAELRRMPPHTWPRYWQDAAFFTVYNWEGTGSGAAHWAGGRWHCAPVRA